MNTVFFIVTNECNNGCFYCLNKKYIENTYNKYSKLEKIHYEKTIADLAEFKTQNIILTGGEPLLHPEIFDIIGMAKNKGIHTVLLTNGETINNEILNKLRSSGLNGITLSLSKLLDQSAADYRSQLASYISVSEKIIKCFGSLSTVFLLTSKNYKSCFEIYKKFSNKENKGLIIQPLHIENESNEFSQYSLKTLKQDQWKTIKEQLSDWMINYNTYNYVQLIYDYYFSGEIHNISCFMGSDSMIVDLYGNAFPCFHKRDMYLGNIQVHPLRDIVMNCIHKSNALIDAGCISSKCLSLFLNYV